MNLHIRDVPIFRQELKVSAKTADALETVGTTRYLTIVYREKLEELLSITDDAELQGVLTTLLAAYPDNGELCYAIE